ncbi:hypothetical protein GGS20DRAFT_581300 [Poronia punctata]|nr:hypothetical protein GGS20DRAFT_581300 [Poronia punctata]
MMRSTTHEEGGCCTRYGLPGITEINSSDGANDAHPHQQSQAPGYDNTHSNTRGGIPEYDVERDADSIPHYTREHLHKLSQGLGTRLGGIDHSLAQGGHGAGTGKRSNAARALKALYYTMLLLGIIWAIISIVSLISLLSRRRHRYRY